MPAWPFTYGFPPRPLPVCPLRRLRGPVGGVAPIREVEDAFGVAWDEDEAAAAVDPCREFNRARGARGGALPDIGEHDGIEDGGREGSRRVVDEVVVVGQAASPSTSRPCRHLSPPQLSFPTLPAIVHSFHSWNTHTFHLDDDRISLYSLRRPSTDLPKPHKTQTTSTHQSPPSPWRLRLRGHNRVHQDNLWMQGLWQADEQRTTRTASRTSRASRGGNWSLCQRGSGALIWTFGVETRFTLKI